MKDDIIERELEKLVDKMLKDETLNVPSLDFTAGIMLRIQVTKHNAATKYEPLISKKAWGMLVMGLFIAFVFLFLMEDSSTDGMWYNNFEIPQLELPNLLVRLSDIPISDTLVYGILVFTFLLYVQIFVLKRYLDARF